ncbi:cysteine rich repeat-containing protein [Ancylobacter sp. MQZ15Z-1]|uniref:Cysteine rich repeat-containing protein n=1 Tax=Ancylobacter mangrovi TaxID=2972472 RepID=A0A9X2T0N6_9HYPH|nr:cysteine rich repeat-containing protein [Ancylobacter mangrovi]MCS0494060.1 cysteine rich repeat-containing protein [Ancylobacter mangrovi]
MLRRLNLRAALVLALAGIAGVVLTGSAFAQTPAMAQNLSTAQRQAIRAACEADIRSACAGIQPGGGRILECMKANPDKISQPCKDALLSARAAQAQ